MKGKYNSGFVKKMISNINVMLESNSFNDSDIDRETERFLMDCTKAIASTYCVIDDEDFKDDLLEVEEIIDTLLMM